MGTRVTKGVVRGMLRAGSYLGPFTDWVRSVHGIELMAGRRRLDLTRQSIGQALYDSERLYVLYFGMARGVSRFLYTGPEIRARRLPSLWDWECVVHGPQPARSDGTCRRCGRATLLTIIWRDRDAVASLVGPVRVVRGRIMYAGRIYEPGEVVDVMMTRDGALYAKVLGFELMEVEVPEMLLPAEVGELVWSPPKEVLAE
ncbi:MAG: hypothetical protein QXP81_09725 [Nitrososphaerota archaeon]